jgi:tetratricopeptide (TPR) repeat protein
MESPYSAIETALLQAALGLNNAALSTIASLGDSIPSHMQVAKAHVLLQLGQYNKAVDVLEMSSDDSVHARLVLAKALFLNQENERAIVEVQKLKERVPSEAGLSEAE